MWLECHVARKSVKVLVEVVGWSLASGRGDLSALLNDENAAQRVFGEGWSNYPPSPIAVPPAQPLNV